jgi:glutaredoxin-related protein
MGALNSYVKVKIKGIPISKEKDKMKVYGTDICIDCRNYKAIQAARGFEAEYIDITENTANLRDFLSLRDHDPVFDAVRANGGIGIPLFVREDGTKTFDMNEAFSWIGQEPVREEEIVEHRENPNNG